MNKAIADLPATSVAPPVISIQLSRIIHAPRERVFEAWTKPESIRQWFGPAHLQVASVDMDLEKRTYRIAMTHGSDCEGVAPELKKNPPAAEGEYVAIDPPSLLSFTWRSDWRPGEETLVTLRFSETAEGTLLELTQEGFLTQDSSSGHDRGWNSSLAKLAALLSQ